MKPENALSRAFFSKNDEPPKGKRILIVNYAMNSLHPIFPHQIEIVRLLSKHFDNIDVITHDFSGEEVSKNTQVYKAVWETSSNFGNALRFLTLFFRLIRTNKPDILFNHMTEVQSILVAPLAKALRIKHYLWYAHKSKSIYLLLNRIFVARVITSTPGSCPISGKKVFPIGQSVSPSDFPFLKRTEFRKRELNAVHIGRIDPAKGIRNMINVVSSAAFRPLFKELVLIGNSTSKHFAFDVELKNLTEQRSFKFIRIKNSIPRAKIPTELSHYDLFLHSYIGSLDKTLIEATMVGIPVITINPEYLKNIGRWRVGDNSLDLADELQAYLELDSQKIEEEILRRREIVLNEHSLDYWIIRLVAILKKV